MPDKLVPPQMPEFFAPNAGSVTVTDDALRWIAAPGWVAHDESAGDEPNWWAEVVARALAAELPPARARIAELEREAGDALGWRLAIAARNNELEQFVAAREARIAELEAERDRTAAFVRFSRKQHTWECANRTRIGVPELDACDCPEVDRG